MKNTLLEHKGLHPFSKAILNEVLKTLLIAEDMQEEYYAPLMRAIKAEVEQRLTNFYEWRIERIEDQLSEYISKEEIL